MTTNDITGQKTISRDISILCHPVIMLYLFPVGFKKCWGWFLHLTKWFLLLQVKDSTRKTPQVKTSCQQIATSLSTSSSCNKSVKIRLVAICHLQTCYNLLKQLVTSLLITSYNNQLATSLLTTCNRFFVNYSLRQLN